MKLSTALEQTILRQATVVAGANGLDRQIAWVHIIDHPDITQWLKVGDVLLTTGYNWPRDDEESRVLVRTLNDLGLAGVVLAVPHFREHFSEATIAQAEQCNFPLLELPWEVPFSEITQEILAKIINLQTEIIQRSDLIHRKLTRAAIEADNLDSLGSALASALEMSALVVSASGDILSEHDIDTNEQFERDLIAKFIAERPLEHRFDEAQTLSINLSDTRPRFRLGCAIWLQGEVAGIVWLESAKDQFEELHSRALEHSAVIAALHLSHQRELLDQETRLGHALVAGLLEGKFPETPSAIERALVSGWSETRDYRICLVLLDEPIPLSLEGFKRRKEKTARIFNLMISSSVSPLISVSLNQISFIIPATLAPETIWKQLRHEGGAMAVSRVHRGVSGMAQGAEDVAALVPLLRPGRLHVFNEVLFPRALMGDKKARGMLIQRLIEPLANRKNGTMLLETVCALSSEGFQLANTAKVLEVHISTLRYRLARIEKLLDISLENPESRFQIQVAAEMYRLEHDE
ncbi:PucR family transcriptional regulator [Pseudomonas sp. MUP55]|uniref:PucR family transcriptional regulator n=1 Tax=Pseudomonas sp. MUP55 TaxID=3087234 RepID=UPI002A59F97A|nr:MULTISPECIES: PucR family transcriptional regulator [unclassified Pseudomonas]WPN90402.1 PucR family transcriptional regulator [Pseudomonas sp. MUP56]WPN95927.1 PucR family transcriptional regulator [Pseudomonas sp. MUP55]